MDYLLRDSHYCGVEYGICDFDKLIDSLTVVSIHGNMVLAIRQNGIQAVVETQALIAYIMDDMEELCFPLVEKYA